MPNVKAELPSDSEVGTIGVLGGNNMYTHDRYDDQVNLKEMYRYLETEANNRYRLWKAAMEKGNKDQAEREKRMYSNYLYWSYTIAGFIS